jgi:hypothetical protein
MRSINKFNAFTDDLSMVSDLVKVITMENEFNDTLGNKKKPTVPTLDELLTSIPDDFQYPEDVSDFITSQPEGEEKI